MLLNDEAKKEASDDLLSIVQDFNQKFGEWMEKTGCRATFGWLYGADKAVKLMEIQAIDAIVYRKEPPKFQTIKDVMDKGAPV